MATGIYKRIRDYNGNIVLPITHMNAVQDNNGRTIGSRMSSLEQNVQSRMSAFELQMQSVQSTLTDLIQRVERLENN